MNDPNESVESVLDKIADNIFEKYGIDVHGDEFEPDDHFDLNDHWEFE